MPLDFFNYYFQAATYTDYTNASIQWNLSGSALNPNARDVYVRFLEVYTQYNGDMLNAWEYCQGNGVVRYNDGAGYTYWKMIQGAVPIDKVIYNGVELKEFKYGSTVVFKLAQATFAGLSGASPSSYLAQDVRVDLNEQVVSPGSPSKSGYTFAGWSPSLPRTIAVNTVFTAQWSQASTWTYLGTSSRPYDLNASSIGIGKCPSSTAARTSLTNVHPPQNYSLGTVARVQCYANGDFPPPPVCATFYYERT